jgi:hypothetical protein
VGGRRHAIAALTLLLLAASPVRALDGGALRVSGGRLLDRRGREVTLRGVNARVRGIFDVTFDDGRLPLEPIPVFDAGDAARMQALGFDLLRLPISWERPRARAGPLRRRLPRPHRHRDEPRPRPSPEVEAVPHAGIATASPRTAEGKAWAWCTSTWR